MSDKVRGLAAIFTIDAGDDVLTPDLSAAVDVELASWRDALAVPRDALTWRDGKPGVLVGPTWREVVLAGTTDVDAVITDGVREGEVVTRSRERQTS